MGVTKDEMVGWQNQFNGHEFEHTPGRRGIKDPGFILYIPTLSSG